jgi:type VI secretion system VgrG family protein
MARRCGPVGDRDTLLGMKDFVQVRVESSAFAPDTVEVAELSGRESISQLFEFELRLVTLEASLDEEALLTNPVTLIFERKASDTGIVDELRKIPGMVRAIRDRALGEAKHREYVVTLVPRAWQASLTSMTDVCMDLTVPEIIEKKLQEGAALEPGTDIELRLKNTYPKREFVVQYRETNLDFACRLAEDLGIHFFFEEVDGRDVMVFADDNSAFKPTDEEPHAFSARGDRTQVYDFEAKRQLVSKVFVQRDYNHRNPSMDVRGEAQALVLGTGRIDEYGAHVKTPDEAAFYARVRAEEAAARHLTYDGRSDLPCLRAGSLLSLEGHPRGDLEIVVTDVVHELTQPVFGLPPATERPYDNAFAGLPSKAAYRPRRLTAKPVVSGVVTGIVESESATKVGAIDDQGRYRVMFMFDSVSGRGDGKASRPLRMAQPSAGAGRGFHAPLKPGTEVIITCVNGDPDRPIITGAVPNPQTPSPVTSANSEKSMWTTNVNSIAIDDDKPRCKVSVDSGMHVLQLGEPNGPELGVLISTQENFTTRAKKVQTSYSELKTTWNSKKLGVASADILQAAGVPDPISTWDKVEKIADKAAEFANSIGEMLNEVQGMFDDALNDARDASAAADEALEDAKKKSFDKLAKGKATPKPIVDGEGVARYETEAEAEKRTYAEAMKDPANKATADELQVAVKEAADARQEKEELEAAQPGAQLQAAAKEGVAEIKEAGKYVQEQLAAAKAQQELHGPAMKALGADKLISKLSEVFAKATQQSLDATVSAAQKVAHAVPKASGQRTGDDVGSFASPHNIQLSRSSASLFGWKNAFLFGGKTATIFSPNTVSVLGRKRVDVKSTVLVEVAAKKVAVSTKKELDVYSDGTVLMVAASKGVKMPAGSSVVIHGQKDAHFVSDDESVHVKANKNVSVLASEGNLVLTAKKGDLLASTQQGKLEVEAAKGTAKIVSKQKLELQTKDGDFALLADKGNGTVKTAKELKLNCKSGKWKAASEIEVKAKTIKVVGKVLLG